MTDEQVESVLAESTGKHTIAPAAASPRRLSNPLPVLIPMAVAVAAFGISSTATIPDHAIVHLDRSRAVYVAPPCIDGEAGTDPLPVSVARELGATPDEACIADGAFVAPARSLGGRLLERAGLLSPLPSRWNDDGTWNW